MIPERGGESTRGETGAAAAGEPAGAGHGVARACRPIHRDSPARPSDPLLPGARQPRRVATLAGWAIVGGSYAALLFAHVWPARFDSETPFWVATAWAAFMLRTFGLHVGVALLAFAAVVAFARCWRMLVATAPPLLVTLGPSLWLCLPRSTPAIAGQPLRIMSFNLLRENPQTQAALAEIRAARPDLLLLLEYTPRWHETLNPALAPELPHARHLIRRDSFGLAIYSRLPFVGEPQLPLRLGDAGTPQVRAVVRLDGRELVMYGVHLMPPFRWEWIVDQRQQFVGLLERVRGERSAVVLAGDFNFTNSGAFAEALRVLGMTDAHEIAGLGVGTTWPNHFGWLSRLPGIRIDHIFVSRELTSRESRVGVGGGSDHRPVVALIGFRKE